jgi:hypothetical protein
MKKHSEKLTSPDLFIQLVFLLITVLIIHACTGKQKTTEYPFFSGIYPHLAFYNEEGECGTGAIVPWGDRLWVVSYGPHMPKGSSDKLYEITSNLQQLIYPGSIGGTPANRMIHDESKQLFIGPYIIDSACNIRVIPYDQMPGRHTGNARHLIDPAGRIYYGTMEEGFYEVDVKTLQVTTLYTDGNVKPAAGQMAQYNELLPGAHGKGLYSGQGVLVYSNNGEATAEALDKFDVQSGVLAEWNGKDWKVIRRNQFVEVTGPGGIHGNKDTENDPIWVTGWDHKSVLVGVRGAGGWQFFRLPKASHSYDGAHGWNTEWPRIRDVGTANSPDYLMTMHGMFWRFPGTFSRDHTAGIRPRSSYLKVIGDFARWNDQLVFGCDDSAQKEFLNKRKAKGDIAGPGQSNSNLWFTGLDVPDKLGPNTAGGAVWLKEPVVAGVGSEPFIFTGWDNRSVWIKNHGSREVEFVFEKDNTGNNQWEKFLEIKVKAGESRIVPFKSDEQGEWVRVTSMSNTEATAYFCYAQNEVRDSKVNEIFNGLAGIKEQKSIAGLLWSPGENRRSLGVLAGTNSRKGFVEAGYYELDSGMHLIRKADDNTAAFIREKIAIPKKVVTVEQASVLVVDDRGRRWRLPKGDPAFDQMTEQGLLRICREVATERDLFNCHGTFYELPAENADGFAKIRPVSSHAFQICDYASYRGLLIISGLRPDAKNNQHIIRSSDGMAAIWAGTIDDLWKLGKPVGEGGPWNNSLVKRDEPSDPYLIGYYDHRTLRISHQASKPIKFRIQADPSGDGEWMDFLEQEIQPGETFEHTFPEAFQARWIRFIANGDCTATAILKYD